MEAKKRGLMIVFEGLDRCGKSTQAKKLKSFFETISQKAEVISFPDRSTESGKILDLFLKQKKNLKLRASHLLFSFNRWEKAEDIISKLYNGVNIILDRYAFSGVAYSIAKGESVEWCLYPDQGLPRPDIVFQLDTDLDKIKIRDKFGEERHDNVEFLIKVKQAYCNFHNYSYWNILDASNDVDEIHNNIIKLIKNLMDSYENTDNEGNKNYYPLQIGEDLFKNKT